MSILVAGRQQTSPAMKISRDNMAQNPIEKLLRFLQKKADGCFFGKVVISFQNGKVCDVRIEQTKKLEEL